MNILFAIILVSLVLGWIFTKELPMIFGVLAPTGAIKRVYFWSIALAAIVLSMLLPCVGNLAAVLRAPFLGASMGAIALVAFATFIAALLLNSLGMRSSIVMALLGAFEAYRVLSGGGEGFDFAMMGGWFVAPIVAALVAALLCFAYRVTVELSHVHFIKLAVYLRYAAILGLVLVAVALGINQGLLASMLSGLFVSEGTLGRVLPMVLLLSCALLLDGVVRKKTDQIADKYFDFSTQIIIVVTYATAVALLIFSSEVVTHIGLRPSPQSVTLVVIGALLGVGVVMHRQTIERSELYRIFFGCLLSPVLAIFCYMFLLPMVGAEVVDSSQTNATILVLVLLLSLVVIFARYARKQEQLKISTRKLLYSQQQQLFENQKALNDMELKAILAENQSLHGTLELKRQENINAALGISEQKEFLEAMAAKVRKAAKSSTEEKDRIIAELENDLTQRIGSSGEVDEFYTQAELLHKDFSVKLTEEFPNLTTSERRLATLLRLGFSSKYIATLMNISPKSVEISRYRLRQKLGLQRGDNLIKFIKSI